MQTDVAQCESPEKENTAQPADEALQSDIPLSHLAKTLNREHNAAISLFR